MNQQPAYPPAFSPTPTPDPTGTITQEHLKASLRSAVEDKVRRSLREEYATKQVQSTNQPWAKYFMGKKYSKVFHIRPLFNGQIE